jgi:hypothetical protein
MNSIKRIVLASIATIAIAPLAVMASVSANWFTDSSGSIQFRDTAGSLLGNSYNVEVGVFSGTPDFSKPGALPTFTSLATGKWDSNILGGEGLNGQGGASLSFGSDLVTGAYTSGASAGMQVYGWVFNSKALAGSSQWAVVTNANWVLPTITDAVDGFDWSITDANTSVVFGTVSGNNVGLVAVPEPSTYAAILGLATLGLVGFRRFRR